jgi:cytoskeletal protein RodZ
VGTDPTEKRTVGSILRATRESKGVTLEVVATATRIRLSLLRDLENDRFDSLPPKVYVTGFIKNYCIFLGVDPQAAIEAHNGQTATAGVKLMPDTGTPVGAGKAVSYRSLLLLVAVLGALVVGTNLLYRGYRSPDPSPTPAATFGSTTAAAVQTVLPAFNAASRTAEPTANAIVIEAIAEMNVNILATADGKPVFSGFMNPGERKLWTAAESVSLITDNAGGLRIMVNGQPQGQLGRVGERLERRWEAN